MEEKGDASRVVRNTAFLNSSTLITRGMGFIISILIARYLGAANFGKYTFALQFTGIFIILNDLGLNYTTVREVARDNSIAAKYLGQTLIIRIFSFLLSYSLIVIIVNVMGYSPLVKTAVYLIGLYILLKNFGNSFNAIFLSFERMGYIVFTDILLNTITLFGIVICIYFQYGFISILFVYPIVIIIYNLLSFSLAAKHFVWPDLKIDWSFIIRFIRESFPFVLVGIFLTILTRIDTVMIKNFKGDIATAYYGIGRTLISALLFIPANFNTVFYPLFSRLYKSDNSSLFRYYEKSFHYMIILALPIGVGGTLLANKIVVLFYGLQFQPAVLSFQILIWVLSIQFLYSNVNILLIASNKQKIVARITFVCMLLNIVLNYFLIHRYSYIGASIATLLTNGLLFSCFFILASRELYRPKVFYILLKTSVCVLIMGIEVYLIRSYNVFLVVISAVFLYAGLLYGFKVITKEDIALLKQIRKKK